jgi:predicted outer membrane repeat protein
MRRVILILSAIVALCDAAHAAGVVGTGTPGSCTEGALRRAMTTDGVVTFSCGAAPVTITVASPLATGWRGTASNITIDGAGLVTLSGGGRRQVFTFTGGRVTLRRLNFIDASGINGGAILNGATILIVNQCEFDGNRARYGGAIYNIMGAVTVSDSRFFGNQATSGGAIFSSRGEATTASMTVQGGIFELNRAYDGAALYLESGELSLTSTSVQRNMASDEGGGVYVAGGHFSATRSFLNNNRAVLGGGLFAGPSVPVDLSDTEVSFNTSTSTGGGIYTMGLMNLAGGSIDGNIASNNGGGLYSSGFVLADGVTLAGNRSYADGGAIYAAGGGTVAVDHGTLFNNSAVNGGAGATFGGLIRVDNGLVKNNTASNHGGGFIVTESLGAGFIRVTNSTVSGNRAASGGAIYSGSGGGFRVAQSTLAHNFASSGPSSLYSEAFAEVWDSIILADGGRDNCGGGHYSTIERSIQYPGTSCPGAESRDPLLGPLAYNGGPTETHALLPGSPAIDRGCGTTSPAQDQRGVRRPKDGDGDGVAACDWGAFELEPAPR